MEIGFDWVKLGVSVVVGGIGMVYALHFVQEQRMKWKLGKMKFVGSSNPFVGNIARIFVDGYAFARELRQLDNELVATTGLGSIYVFVFHPDLVKPIQTYSRNPYEEFDVKWPESIQRLFGEDSIAFWKHKDHKNARSQILTHAGFKTLGPLVPVACAVFKKRFEAFLPRFENGKAYVDILDYLEEAIWEFMLIVLVGEGFYASPQGKEYIKHVKVLSDSMQSIPIDLGKHSQHGRGIIARQEMERILLEEIDRRKGLSKEEQNNRFDYLQSIINEDLAKGGDGRTTLNLSNVTAIIFAGVDTTKMFSLRVAQAFASYPDVCEKVRQEAMAALGGEPYDNIEKLTFNLIKGSMPYTWATMLEVLRFYPISVAFYRYTRIDIPVTTPSGKQYVIPKDSTVVTCVEQCMEQNTAYERKFDPEQFLPPKSMEKNDPNGKYGVLTFGCGVRMCPGYEIARFEMVLFLTLWSSFDWKMRDDPNKLEWKATPSIGPVGGLFVTATRKNDSQ